MKSFFTLLAALLFITIATTEPVLAQRRVVRPRAQKVQQPRAFTKQFRQRATRGTRLRPRATTSGTRSANPRFYRSQAASRYSKRLTRSTHSRTRANVSPRRRTPRFYNAGSAAGFSKRVQRSHRRAVRASSRRPGRPTPTFWK